MPKLNKQFKKQWLAALRSGEYKQGTDQLVNGSGSDASHCCLGVAGRVLGVPNSKLRRLNCDSELDAGPGTFLSPKLAKAAGLSNKQMAKLAQLNDKTAEDDISAGKPFRSMIRYISRNL
jgi:hypothetical protein